jgi:hypothetical protein
MVATTQRHLLLDYEADADWGENSYRSEEPVLDYGRVASLLLSIPRQARSTGFREPVAAIGSAEDSDALAAMRGVMIGLALMSVFWALSATVLLLS